MSYQSKHIKIFKPEAGYNLYAPFYNNDFEYLNSFEKGNLFEFFPKDLKGMNILDIGCGSGRILQKLSERGAEITACDISEKMLEKVKNKFKNIKTVKADIEELPFQNSSFDYVIALFIIVHLKYLDQAFSEVYRVLKPGGFFILNNINQRKAPKLKIQEKEEIKIESYYHRKENVVKSLENEFFVIKKQLDIFEKGVWINQLIKAQKLS